MRESDYFEEKKLKSRIGTIKIMKLLCTELLFPSVELGDTQKSILHVPVLNFLNSELVR